MPCWKATDIPPSSVLSVNPPLLRLFFSPDQEREVRGLLKILAKDIPLTVEEWPF